MKHEVRLYNVLLPIWLLWIFPQVWLIVVPGNLLVDCLVLTLALLAMRHPNKRGVLKALWWKIWLLGFAADFVGVVWMFFGWLLSVPPGEWWSDTMSFILYDPFRHPIAFLWTLVGVALAGVCIYFFDRWAMKSCALLTHRQRHGAALAMAVVTAPWLFFLRIY